MRYSVAFDATPLAARPDDVSGHALRGIGAYIDGLLGAVVSEEAAWADEHLRPVITGGMDAPPAGRPLVTRRLGWRRQDLGWLAAWAADRMVARGADISLWHALDPNAPLSPLPARKTVVTAYDLNALHEPEAMAQIRRHRRPLYSMYVRSLRTSRLVLAISQWTADDIEATLGVPRDRIRVVYPALAVPPGRVAEPRQGNLRDLLFVGVPDPSKQAELAIAALAECRRRGHDITLRFAGYHRPTDMVRLQAEAARHRVSDNVEILGRVDRARLTELYRRSVLLAVSRTEGFGLPPAEALLAGGRVVAGAAEVYREVLGNAADFAVSPDGKGLADAYEAAVSRVLGGPPPELVERFSPRASAAALMAAYKDALE